jgi:hypothetical protein
MKRIEIRNARLMTTSLDSFIGQTLTWVPTAAFRDRYALIAPNNTTLAELDMSSWSSKANATVPEGTLFIHKEGWTGLKAAIYAGEQGPLVATFQRKRGRTNGQLLFPDGHEFQWAKTNFWGTQNAWVDATGSTAYVQFAKQAFSRKSTVIIQPQSGGLPELSLLVVLGLYNIHIEQRRQNSNAATVAAINS